MPKMSLDDLQRVLFRQEKELQELKERFDKFITHYNDTIRNIDERFDLRTDITQQNAEAIQTLSIRMNMITDHIGMPRHDT